MLNEILENDLKKSLFIEYYYGRKIVPSYFLTENKHTLCEEHGIMPHMDDYIDVFLDYMHKFEFSEEPKTIRLKENIFSNIENCFFNNILLSIDLCKTEKNNVHGYMNLSRNTEIEDGKISWITGHFHIYCNEDKLDSSLATMIAHELTHMYENYKRVTSNSPSLYDVVTNSNYSNNTDRYGKGEYDRKLISYIVYYTTKFEVNAYAASIYGTLKAHADELVNAHDAVDVIKYYSPVYQNYAILGDYIQRLNMRWLDEEETKLIEDAWFSAMGEKRKCSYIIKKLTSLYSKNWRKLRKVIAKISYDVYEKFGPSYTIDDDNLIN
jgi:hypothetical protein